MTAFIYPTVKRVTSTFRGSRKNHNGVDFAKSGYHEIKSVADGVVSRSYTSSSYGECIMIVHTIGNVVWESVYAHMRKGSRKVKEGQKVKQGQVIGVMGNTGDSTGQHLHFELHKGRWNIKKSNAVDPLQYLGNIENDIVLKTYHLKSDSDGYMTSDEAKKRKNKKTLVKKGQYYVFNQSKGMVNLTKKQGVAGVWINPETGATPTTSLKVGNKVKVTGNKYATGETVPSWVKKNVYRVMQVKGNRVLLSDIHSWVGVNDVKKL